MVMMRMENGCQCVVQSNFNIPDEASTWRVEIFGDKGRLIGNGVIGQVDGGTLDAITGATITSRAICVGVNAALDCVAGLG